MTQHEMVTTGTEMRLIDRRAPDAYRPKPGGPKTEAWMRKQGWLDGPRVEPREKV